MLHVIGIDEAGRGPLFGRVYAGAVVLPARESGLFDYSILKDSKKFHSKKKIRQAADYIKDHAVAWSVCYESEKTIDEINILQATQNAMHACVKDILTRVVQNNAMLLVDGNYFRPYPDQTVQYQTIEGGDDVIPEISAASILAKVSRDEYIDELCKAHPELNERYSIHTNKGYGTKKHIDGIKQYGITQWHRRTFAPCR